ncbi:DUF6221 family protein [Micromonospora sp. DPT]|uniref:DUF6221 family protein n=1 Tax=Micromonospora sp. DPT TaxID=3142975 RepID=UPI00320B009D
MSDDLVTWLRAQLDIDEKWARDTGGPLYGEPHDVGTPGHHARVLAEVDAKRRIIDKYELWSDEKFPDSNGGYASALADVLSMLALPYADRPGYRDEWKP